MGHRIKELDYLKCVFIILMVIFHLVYIADTYPYLKQIVYTFHMPAFLIISGYLTNINKTPKAFLVAMCWIVIPYVLLEASYVVMSSVLPVREKIAELSAAVLIEKIFVKPIGPYWYLHTLVLCSLTYYFVFSICRKLSGISRLIIVGLSLLAICHYLNLMSFGQAIYFMIGIAIHQSKNTFLNIFRPSALAIIAIVILSFWPENLDRSTLSGIAITYFAISFLLYAYRYIPNSLRQKSCYIGQHTLIILLFSPIFTILSKSILPFLSFDHTGLIYMFIATTFTISGCFLIAWILDSLKLSRFLVGTTLLNRR